MKKAASKSKSKALSVQIKPKKSDFIPVTKKVVDKTRAELSKKDASLKVEMRAGFKSVGAQFKATDAKIDGLREEMKAEMGSFRAEMKAEMGTFRAEMKSEMGTFRAEMKSEMGSFRAKMKADMNKFQSEILLAVGKIAASVESLSSQVQRTQALVEENTVLVKYALDGYAAVDHRIDTLEKKIKDV
jgi:peptidoglycan hydrolase CwlO-like protein